jgi:hypothetical protein
VLLRVRRAAVEQHPPARGRQDAGEDVEQRGLAAARRSADAQELVLAHAEADVVVDQQLAVGVADVHVDLQALRRRHVHAGS